MNIASTIMTGQASKRGYMRYVILAMLFTVTTLNYADRATISIAGSAMKEELHFDSVTLGYIFSAFSWAYVLGQIPGGWLLDRFGSKKVYAWSIFLWSIFTLLQGGITLIGTSAAIGALFLLRFIVGLSEAPAFPANSRIVVSWFPAKERGTASAIFNSAQYFAAIVFTPLMAWITHNFGWKAVFVFMGLLGVVIAAIWLKAVHSPKNHPGITKAEYDYLAEEGALVNMDDTRAENTAKRSAKWSDVKQLLRNRMLLGIYIGQYCVNVITYFFLTWFPVYLVQERGMSILKAGFVASIPAVCGFIGGVLGGVISDKLIKNGKSVTFARKAPIVIGMLLSTTMILCNFITTQWLVIAIMALAFFGKGIGALGWAVIADTAPKETVGVSGAIFNTFGNIAGIVTPIVIGYILKETGSFNGALIFVCCNALVGALSYLVIVKEIKRVELKQA